MNWKAHYLVALFLVGWLSYPLWNAVADDAPPLLSEQEIEKVRSKTVLEENGWVYAIGKAQPLTQSSASKKAAEQKARLDAISKLVEDRFFKSAANSEILNAVAPSVRAGFLDVLAKNYTANATLQGFAPIQSGFKDGFTWVVVAGSAEGLDVGGGPDVIGLAKGLLANPGQTMSARQADHFYEATLQLGLSPSKEFWQRHQPKDIQAQIQGRPIEKIFRLWMQNESSVEELFGEPLSIDDLFKCMQLLPYNKRVNDALVKQYQQENKPNCAEASLLEGFVCLGSAKSETSPAWPDVLRCGDASNSVVRIIVAADGKMPAQEESPGALFTAAMANFLTNAPAHVREQSLAALTESINADTLNLYGTILRRMGLYELGAVMCRQAYTCRPDHPYALINEAMCYEALSKHDEAKKWATEALKNNKIDEWTRTEAGKILQSN